MRNSRKTRVLNCVCVALVLLSGVVRLLMQDVEAADIRTMEAAGEWKEQLEKALEAVRGGADPVEESLRFCEKIRKAGQRILWDPGRKEGTV